MTWSFFTQFQSTGPTPTPTPTTPGTGVCQITDSVNAWNTGLTSTITITNTNTSPTAISGWSLVFTLASGQTITSGWNANYSPASRQVTATNLSYDAQIAPGGSTTIGFQADHTGSAAAPTSFTLNGTACAVT